MSSTTRVNDQQAADRKQMRKGLFAAAVIVACVAFLVWSLWPAKPVVIAEATDPASQWMKAYGAYAGQHSDANDPFYLATARIRMAPNADNTGIVVEGNVSNAAQLNLLKAELGKLTPAVPLTWQVNIVP